MRTNHLDNQQEPWSIKVCRHIKSVLSFMCRYPAFRASKINEILSKTSATSQEAQQFWMNCASFRRRRVLFIVPLYIAYFVKNAFIPYLFFQLFDYSNLSANIRSPKPANDSSGGTTSELVLRTFACLATNCSRLGPALDQVDKTTDQVTRLAEEASNLPLFMLCHPKLDLIYTPVTKLGVFGMFAFTISATNVLLLGAWLPVQQLVFPAENMLIMFIVAPELTRRLMRLRAHELLMDLAISQFNYQSRSRLSRLAGRTHGTTTSTTTSSGESAGSYIAPAELACSSYRRIEQQRLHTNERIDAIIKQTSLRNKSPDEIERLIDECMPAIRSEWWRLLSAKHFVYSLSAVMMSICLIGLSVFIYLQYRVGLVEQTLLTYSEHMRRTNCALWFNHESEAAAIEPIELDQLDLSWSHYAWVETMAINHLPGFGMAMLFTYYVALVNEISIWVAETRIYLTSALVASRLQAPRTRSIRYKSDHNAHESPFSIRRLQSQLVQETRLRFTVSLNTKIEHRVDPLAASGRQLYNLNSNERTGENFLLQRMLLDGGDAGRHAAHLIPDWIDERPKSILTDNIETFEQIYINFRLFVEHVRDYTPTVVVLLTIVYLLSYSLALIAVYYGRTVENFTAEPLFMSTSAWCLSSLLIFWAANFHANAKKLQPILWSIIAQMASSDDMRVKHLRSLWLKQMQILDNEGGLALSAFGIRVTHVNILQLMIWMVTVFAIALNKQ